VKELDVFCLSGDGMRLQANEQFVAPMRASVSPSMQSETCRMACLCCCHCPAPQQKSVMLLTSIGLP